jgi:aryl-alcohol dehydrogenase-like predicted oxidoreductase
MKKIKIDNVNFYASKLSFGTSSLHRIYSKKQRLKILNVAIECGITHFDTSPLYGHGIAERDLGLVLKINDSLTVASKICLYPKYEFDNINNLWIHKAFLKIIKKPSIPIINYTLSVAEKSLDKSLKKLNRETIDVLFIHDPVEELLNSHEYFMWFEKQKKIGKIKNFGLSGNPKNFENLIINENNLTNIIQSKDSLDKLEANKVIKNNRLLQFTFGYFINSKFNKQTLIPHMNKVLMRNKSGSILFSSLNIDHIQFITKNI